MGVAVTQDSIFEWRKKGLRSRPVKPRCQIAKNRKVTEMPQDVRPILALVAFFGLPVFTVAHAQTPETTTAPVVAIEPPVVGGETLGQASAESATDLAKKLQNPIGNLTSIPLQNNVNFNYGPNRGTQDILNIQPVVPFSISENWNLITRTILPLVWQPSLQPAQTVPFGTGPTTFSAFVSPKVPVNGWVWGVGPVVQVPTISSKTLGSNIWGAGPSAVAVQIGGGAWVYGALINNVFSVGGTSGPAGTRYNQFTLNPFLNYNFGEGWFVGTVPVITANWLTSGDKAWTLPVGAQVGRLIKLGGKLPVNLLIGAYYNALRPQFGSTWQLRTQIAVIF